MSTITGYIYKIEYNEDKEIRYIGSTMRSLKSRLNQHKKHYLSFEYMFVNYLSFISQDPHFLLVNYKLK